MKDEYLDIVGKNDKPTGEKRLRSEAHSTGLLHRSVHVYIFRENNSRIEFLAHLRAPDVDLYPNCWDSRFGGHLKSGQMWKGAAVVELEEETGLRTDISELLKGPKRISERNPKNREVNQVYYYQFDGDIESLKLQDDEVIGAKWLEKDKLANEIQKNQEGWTTSIGTFLEISNFLEEALNEE